MTPENIIRIVNIILCIPGIIGSVLWMYYAKANGRDWKAVFLYTLPCMSWLLIIMVYTALLLIRPDWISTQIFVLCNNVIRTIAICTMSYFVLVDGFYWYQQSNIKFHEPGRDN